MTQLILQHGQQVGNDVQALRQEADALIHFQIAPDGAVDRLELGLGPHELGAVEDGTLQVDVDAQDEELADLHVDLAPGEVDGAGQGNGFREVFGSVDGVVDEVFEEGGLEVGGVLVLVKSRGGWSVCFKVMFFGYFSC